MRDTATHGSDAMRTRLLILLILCAHLAAGPVTWARETAPATAPAKDANAPAEKTPAAKSDKSATDAAPAKDAGAPAKDAAAPAEKAAEGKFDAAHLEQMAAPVALYPDSLLMQLLMAATYPLEIVEAARWVKDNPKVTGDAIDAAIKEQDWDPSVKSLCRVPDVLTKMNENLDWTRDLGDAFLGQQTELLDAVQRLRQKAKEAGHLKSTKEQTVTVQEDKTIIIKESSTEVIYVPSYNPTVVYGPAWPPPVYYAPMYVYPPGAAFFTFSIGFAMGAAMWGGCNWGWGHSDVDINVNNYNNFNRNTNINSGNTNIGSGNTNVGAGNTNRGSGNTNVGAGNTSAGGGKQKWEHNPEHRKGVNYKSADTAQRFGGSGTSNRVSSSEARGYSDRGGAAGNRPSTSDRGGRNTGAGASTANRGGGGGPSASTANRGGSRDSAFSGSNNASFDRAASQRGSSSRSGGGSHSGASRSGGASRGGGSRGGGGGGRRR